MEKKKESKEAVLPTVLSLTERVSHKLWLKFEWKKSIKRW